MKLTQVPLSSSKERRGCIQRRECVKIPLNICHLPPQILSSNKAGSSTSNAKRDSDETEDDEIHLNVSKEVVTNDEDPPIEGVDWFVKDTSHDTIMVEQDQTPLPNKTLKEAGIAEASLGEGIRDDGDSSSGLDNITTPFFVILLVSLK